MESVALENQQGVDLRVLAEVFGLQLYFAVGRGQSPALLTARIGEQFRLIVKDDIGIIAGYADKIAVLTSAHLVIHGRHLHTLLLAGFTHGHCRTKAVLQ